MSEYLGEKIYLGENVADLNIQKPFEQYSKVIFNFENNDGENNYVEAGSDGGQVLELTIQALTDSTYAREIAENVLDILKTKDHKPYDATDAMLDPAFELGDAVTLPELYTVIGSSDEICDSLYSASISAKGRDETEDEFIYKTQSDKNIQRQLTKTRASLRIDVDRIALEVAGKIDGEDAQTLIDQSIGEISLSVSGTNGRTKFTLKQGSTTLDTETVDLHVKSVNIEGTLTAEALRGRTVSLLDSADDVVGSMTIAHTTTGDGLAIKTDYGGIRLNSGGNVYISSVYGTRLLLDDDAAKIGPTVLATNGDIIYESDRNVKNSIDYDLSRYRQFLLDLKPCRFKYNEGQSGRYHLGMIAQDMEQSLAENGISPMDFSGWCKIPIRNENHEITGYTYGIRYGALIPLNTMLIQELIRRVDALERQTAS